MAKAPRENPNPPLPKQESMEDYKARQPIGGSGKQWSEWAKQNPNRIARARATHAALSKSTTMPTTMTKEGTAARSKEVAKWKKARPESGAHVAKDAQGAEQRRKNMIEWSKWNPNRKSNAARAVREAKKKK